jgi:hypothetical protein
LWRERVFSLLLSFLHLPPLLHIAYGC